MIKKQMEGNWVVNKVCTIFSYVFYGMEQSKWSELPDLVVIDILKCLKDKDRSSCALVCTNWARLFKTPYLWRTRHFDMGGYRIHNNGSRACAFASMFGKHVRYLSISCSHPAQLTTKIFQKAIADVLGKMCKAKLFEFEIERLELDRYWKYHTSRDRLVSCFVRFFKTQQSLIVFDMTTAECNLEGGCRILDTLGNNSGSKIECLYIEDFFQSRIAVFQTDRYNIAISKFTNIRYIGINYNCLSGEIIQTFSKTLEGKLEFMNIKVFKNNPHVHRIEGHEWSMLCRKCPRLGITIWFESIGLSTNIIPILAKEIPLRDLHIWTGYEDDLEWRLSTTLDHIADSFHNSLTTLSLEMDNTHEFVDFNIVNLLHKCRKLDSLTLNAVILISTIETICNLQSERKIGLRFFHLTACGLSEEEWITLCQLKDQFADMIEEQNLDFKFCTDLLIDLE